MPKFIGVEEVEKGGELVVGEDLANEMGFGLSVWSETYVSALILSFVVYRGEGLLLAKKLAWPWSNAFCTRPS